MIYSIIEQTMESSELGEYRTYGITYEKGFVNDVTLERDKLENLVNLMNEYDLANIHLMDVVEDFLAE